MHVLLLVPAPASFDHLAPENLQNPFEFYAALRAHDPVYWSAKYRFWMLTRYADVKQALQDAEGFSSSYVAPLLKSAQNLPEQAVDDFNTVLSFRLQHLQALDNPVHSKERAIVSGALMQVLDAALKGRLTLEVQERVQELRRKRRFDFVADFAYPLPLALAFALLGIPREFQTPLQRALEVYLAFPQAVHQQNTAALAAMARSVREAEAAFAALMRAPQTAAPRGMLQLLAIGQTKTPTLTVAQIAAHLTFLVFAGHETTANLLSTSMHYLLSHRQLWQYLREHPADMPYAVEELLRYVSPVLWVARTTTRDQVVGGRLLPKGSDVRLGLGAANHDPARFEQPEQVILDRQRFSALAFGYGAHSCIGAAFSRLQIQTVLATLMSEMPQLVLETQTFEYQPFYWVRSLKSLWMRE